MITLDEVLFNKQMELGEEIHQKCFRKGMPMDLVVGGLATALASVFYLTPNKNREEAKQDFMSMVDISLCRVEKIAKRTVS